MPSATIEVDRDKLNEVCLMGGFASGNDAVNVSLDAFMRAKRDRQLQVIASLAGKIDFDDDWTPRKARGKE